MSKRKKPPNPYARDLRTPKYKMRVLKDKRRVHEDNVSKDYINTSKEEGQEENENI